MKKMTLISLILASLGVVFIFMAVMEGPCYSADSNVIYACIKKENGQVRIVANPTDCHPSEVLISWNVQGPGYVKESTFNDVIKAKDIAYKSVRCDGNDYVTGCSYQLFLYSLSMSYYHFLRVSPDSCGLGDICHGCLVGLYNSSDFDLQTEFAAYAYCGHAP